MKRYFESEEIIRDQLLRRNDDPSYGSYYQKYKEVVKILLVITKAELNIFFY